VRFDRGVLRCGSEMIERVGPSDIDAVVATLVASHREYGWERWAVPFADRSERLDAIYRVDLATTAFPLGEVWATDDAASVAVWLPHGVESRRTAADRATLSAANASVFGTHLGHVLAVSAALASQVSTEPDWYLATMGTLPARQGRGLGSAVLGPMLERCDDASLTAGLETSEERNLRFYGRLGFATTATVDDLPHGAPTTWIMHRPAKPPAACA
jgi:GNAT superfamily N-acetyltransferase